MVARIELIGYVRGEMGRGSAFGLAKTFTVVAVWRIDFGSWPHKSGISIDWTIV